MDERSEQPNAGCQFGRSAPVVMRYPPGYNLVAHNLPKESD